MNPDQLTSKEGFALMQILANLVVRLLLLAAATPRGELFDTYMAMIEDAQAVLNPITARLKEEFDK